MLQAPKKGLQRCFLASQKRFELPTPALGVAIITYTPSIVVLHDSRSTPNYTVFRGAISSFNIVDTPLYLLVFRSAISKMLAVLQRSQNLNQLVRFQIILEQKCTVIKRTITEDATQLSHIRYMERITPHCPTEKGVVLWAY